MKTVITFWTFDIVHPGHVYFLQQAKSHGDRLVTIVARDQNVMKFKGRTPLHHENQRMQDIKNLNVADIVELGHETDYFFAIRKHNPDVVAIGYDQTYLVKELSEFLYENGYKTEVITIEGFGPDEHKSSILKKKLTTNDYYPH